MGCSNSNPAKELLISPNNPDKVKQILSNGVNGHEKLKNSINETITDVNNLEFKKAQEDLQKIGEGLKEAVGDGVEELMGKVLPTSNGSMTPPPPEEEDGKENENTNTPVPSTPDPNEEDQVETEEPVPAENEAGSAEAEEEKPPEPEPEISTETKPEKEAANTEEKTEVTE